MVTAPPPAADPASVSLQTSQSGFSGLLNHGSAQPRSRQRPHDGGVDILAVEVEQRQLAARLGEPAAQVKELRQSRKIAFQLIVVQRKDVERPRLDGARYRRSANTAASPLTMPVTASPRRTGYASFGEKPRKSGGCRRFLRRPPDLVAVSKPTRQAPRDRRPRRRSARPGQLLAFSVLRSCVSACSRSSSTVSISRRLCRSSMAARGVVVDGCGPVRGSGWRVAAGHRLGAGRHDAQALERAFRRQIEPLLLRQASTALLQEGAARP